MKKSVILWISSGLLIFALFSLWLRLPLISGNIWMSPDETANISSAISYASQNSFGMQSEYTERFLWLVPRSFVFVPETNIMAPVGFLGMPLILSLVYKAGGHFGIGFFVPIFALLSLFALWHILPTKWSKSIKLITLAIWMSFPTIIIYANRGTFPQLTQLCLMIWVWYLVNHERSSIAYPIAGLLTGLALAIRPLEAVWIIPAVIFAFLHRQSVNINSPSPQRYERPAPSDDNVTTLRRYDVKTLRHYDVTATIRKSAIFLLPLIFILLFTAKLGADTYGKWFVSGYQIRPEIVSGTQVLNQDSAEIVSYSRNVTFLQSLPFGIHPRNIIWNIKNYLGIMLLPWTLVLLASLYFLYQVKAWRSKNKWGIAALSWIFCSLVLFYGNGIYQDHVRLNEISVGNSFLRYILPLSLVFAIASGYVMLQLMRHWSLKIFAYCLTVALIMFGIWTGVARDDEGIAANERELIVYRQIRQSAARSVGEQAIILSDRSDKIFFPYWLAVSPMPSKDQIVDLAKQGAEVAIFLTTQDEKGINQWSEHQINLIPRFTIGNQTMYHVQINN
jgi:hypothetical protein